MNIAIGADIGGGHISCVAIDMDNEVILNHTFSEATVNNQASKEEILKNWASALEDSILKSGEANIIGIGLAMPGPFDYAKGIALFERVAKYESLYGVNVGEELKSLLPSIPGLSIRFINDATAFAIGESWFGKGKGSEKFIALTLGTGFGSAFIESGIPVLEGKGIPDLGCLWHLPFKEGIADDYISTRWFLKCFEKISGTNLPGVKELAELAKTDQYAKSLFTEFGENLGGILAPWIINFEAESLVIGGNLTGAYNLFGKKLIEKFHSEKCSIPVHLSELKESAAMIGAARLLNDEYWNEVAPLLSKM